MGRIDILKAELEPNDPLGRGYAGMDDEAAAVDLNTVYRDGPHDTGALLQYLTLERFRTGTLYGRLRLVAHSRPVKDDAAWTIPPLPLGASDADVAITQQHIAAAASLLRYVDTDSALAVTLLDSRITSILSNLTANGGGCGAIGSGDKTAIEALSTGVQSRATELGVGVVYPGHIQTARLP